jgi:hypothetical protein
MPLPDRDWLTQFPGLQDTGTNGIDQMPPLTDDSAPGVNDGHRARKSHPQALRNKLHAACLLVGDNVFLPANSHQDRLADANGQRVKLVERSGNPSSLSNTGFLYTKEVSGVTELFYEDDTGAVIQLTSGGSIVAGPASSPIQLLEEAGDPANVADTGFVYTKDDGGDTELFYEDDGGAVVQITEDGALATTGFASSEEEFTAVAGTQTFTLAATAAVNASMLSGRTILGVFRNGVRSRYQATATLANEWDLPAGNQVRVVAQAGGEIFTVVYGT